MSLAVTEPFGKLRVSLVEVPNGCAPNEGWFILTNFGDFPSAIKAYKKRFDIEEMFRDFKSGGYNARGD